jgi:alpha,alpha-trehalase
MNGDPIMTLENLEDESKEILAYINLQWAALRANARGGHDDAVRSWQALAATSHDGHLDDQDHANPYILYLPNDFITPGGRFVVQFYWDSYFINLGLLRSGHIELARGMVDNCLYLVQKHGMVIANRKRWSAGSQLPFLSSMVREVHAITGDDEWLEKAVPLIEAEYAGYWMNADHLAYAGLSRYHAPPWFPREDIPAITMDHEASWDLSPRFEQSDVLNLLPVDLNCNLYVYELDMAAFARQIGNATSAERWETAAATRGRQIQELFWSEEDGLFYDFDYARQELKKVKSLATFHPLFAGAATKEQAARVASQLGLFEREFGLSTCDRDYGFTDRQWNEPVGWAPLHWIVFVGLRRYGYDEEATRIALKWLSLLRHDWMINGALFEKYDVVAGSSQVLTDRYKNQKGFGWTNGVYVALVNSLV